LYLPSSLRRSQIRARRYKLPSRRKKETLSREPFACRSAGVGVWYAATVGGVAISARHMLAQDVPPDVAERASDATWRAVVPDRPGANSGAEWATSGAIPASAQRASVAVLVAERVTSFADAARKRSGNQLDFSRAAMCSDVMPSNSPALGVAAPSARPVFSTLDHVSPEETQNAR